MWSAAPLLLLLVSGTGAASLDRGAKALKEFRPEAALKFLQLAEKEGPYSYDDKVRLHEQLGIAYAYLKRSEDALSQFALVLALSPGHAISYTLSPKVTFLFEKAREQAAEGRTTNVDLSWPRELEADSPVPIQIEVVADPKNLLMRARLNFRLRGTAGFQSLPLDLAGVGALQEMEIPALDTDAEADTALEIYLSAFDQGGNEVLRWGSATHPREIVLSAPESWYEKWWVWTIIGGAVAAGTGAAVFFVTQEPSQTVDSSFEVLP